ncbi:MAG: phytanoyl-CoA dioxygenase family protein [Planctomycetaceae bacterium]|nr:phytanoyl-CoA dioxygenase family protein [Planctomycetaceae bacterium]
MSESALKAEYDREGFVVVRNFLPPDELAELQANIDRYISEVVPGLPDSEAFYHDKARPETLKQLPRMGHDPYFASYLQPNRWQELAEELIGEPCTPKDPQWFNKPAGTEHPTPPHQDNFYFCFKPPNVLTMWLALDEVDAENGCLRYVPGSHKHGVRPHDQTSVLGFSQGIADYGLVEESQEVEVHASPGDVVIHHGDAIHRADANRSATRERRAFALVYQGESCQRDDDAFARYQASLQRQHTQMGLATK